MKFIKTIPALVVATAILAINAPAMAADGTIHFTGTISSATCTVNSVANTASTRGTVDFGQVNNKTLNGAIGKTTIVTPFDIELTDCVVTSAPKITFEGPAVDASIGIDPAFTSNLSGVGIVISDAGDSSVYTPGVAKANTGFNALGTDVTSATGKFNAKLISSATLVSDGLIDTDVTFVIDYSGL